MHDLGIDSASSARSPALGPLSSPGNRTTCLPVIVSLSFRVSTMNGKNIAPDRVSLRTLTLIPMSIWDASFDVSEGMCAGLDMRRVSGDVSHFVTFLDTQNSGTLMS